MAAIACAILRYCLHDPHKYSREKSVKAARKTNVLLFSHLKMIRLVNIRRSVFLLIRLRLQTQVTCVDL